MAVSKRLRYEILRRDGNACRYCGNTAPDVPLTVDHVIPVALGGSDEPENLATACGPCNSGKSSSSPDAPLVANVAGDALRWAMAMRQASQMQAEKVQERAEYVTEFDRAWTVWEYSDGTHVSRPTDWAAYIGRLHTNGLESSVLCALVYDVLSRRGIADGRMWRYFCGAVRNVMEERVNLATDLLASAERTFANG